MKNKDAKKAIASYYILPLLLTLPLLIPIWLIKEPLGVIACFVCFLIYMRIAINFAVRATVMPSLWKELDAEKYAAIINAKPFWIHYSYKLNLYFAIGNYQSAYNIISSILIQHKNVQQRVYGHLLLCRICFERGDYEGLKEPLDQINNYFKYNPNTKLPKQSKEAYEFYCAFSNADYVSVCALLEESIEKYSEKKSRTYFALIRQYQLAVTKRMKGDIDEAIVLFESIKEKAPKLVLSVLAQKQLEYINGTLEETAPEPLAVTENCVATQPRGVKVLRVVIIIIFCIGCLFILAGKILPLLDAPKQEYENLEYESKIESVLVDDYEDYQILGYFDIYTDYSNENHESLIDTVFLVEGGGKLDLHTLYKKGEENGNILNVKDIQVNKVYEYETMFDQQKVSFVLTKKKRDIPENTLYYYEIDGYYFCVLGITES